MKKIYLQTFLRSFFSLLFIINCFKVTAQCPYGGTPGTTAYDTTIVLASGIVTTQVKFPKFDPQNGMVTCVRLCITIKGVIDTLAMENYTNAVRTGSYTYIRKDTIRGPGIPTYLTSSANITSPGYPLGPFDGFGNLNAGSDFYSQGSDTILKRVLCSTISDSTSIVQFYGINDSVAYDYTVDDMLSVSTGGSAAIFALSSALVNFNFQYCTCPAAVLPLNIKDLVVNKIANNKAELSWGDNSDEQNTSYRYVVEMSKDGKSFYNVGELIRNTNYNNQFYKFIYTTRSTEAGIFFFRVKQVYSGGYTRFSAIKQVYLENSLAPKFTVFPNPSTGIVGIKFDNIDTRKMVLQIFNSHGQKVLQKDILIAGSSYQQVGTLESGIYWIRMTDEKNRQSYVNQLLIK